MQLVVMVEPRPRCGHSAVAARGKLYVCGGKDGSSEVQFARIESFRVRDGRWEGGQEMQTVGFVPRQLYHTAIACGEGAVFSFGGSSGPSERLDRCYRIDVSPPTCTEFCIEGAPPARRSFGGVVYFDRTLVLYGGHTGEGGRDVSAELFVLDLQKSEKYIIESVDSISKDERGFPLTQYITNGRISRGGYTFTHFKHHHRVLRLISYRMGV